MSFGNKINQVNMDQRLCINDMTDILLYIVQVNGVNDMSSPDIVMLVRDVLRTRFQNVQYTYTKIS